MKRKAIFMRVAKKAKNKRLLRFRKGCLKHQAAFGIISIKKVPTVGIVDFFRSFHSFGFEEKREPMRHYLLSGSGWLQRV